MAFYPKANRTIKGVSSGPHLGGPYKGVLHTTEGSSASGAIGAFKKNNSWPHFLIDSAGAVWQFLDTIVGARALRNLSGGVQTNLDSAIQIELVGFAGKPNEHPPAQMAALKELMRWIEATVGVKPIGPGRPFATAYGQTNLRFTNKEWDEFAGWCFPAETLILTDEGLKPIADVNVGDRVLTHKGQWQRVLQTHSRSAETVVLKGQGHYGLETTPEHPFLASTQVHKVSKHNRTTVSDPDWCEANQMEGRYWHSPTSFPLAEPPIIFSAKYAKVSLNVSANLFWVVGRWLGDGCVDSKGRFQIACHSNEAAEVSDHLTQLGIKNHIVLKPLSPNTASVNFTNLSLGRWITTHFGKYAHGKSIPAWALGMQGDYREALLQGYLSADGSIIQTQAGFAYCTVSKPLFFGVKLLAQSLDGSVTAFFEPRKSGLIRGREVTQRDRYRGRIVFETERWLRSYTTDGTVAAKVKSISPGREAVVYNISVEDDESYVADGIIVHNCGHCHVAEQDHWDPGAINLADLLPSEGAKAMYDPALNLGEVVASLARPGGVVLLNRQGDIYAFNCRDLGAPGRHPEYWNRATDRAARLYPLGDEGYYVVKEGSSLEVGSAGWYAYNSF